MRPRSVLIGACLVAVPVAYLAVRALSSRSPLTTAATPLARVGLALQAIDRNASPGERASLRDDVQTVSAAWNAHERSVFDLVVALRGLGSGGDSEWGKAEVICGTLRWPRCDRAALEQMKSSSRPAHAETKNLESVAAFAVANVTWAFGSEDAVRRMVGSELDRLPESDKLHRARVFVRFGIIDSNPDGQAALFAQACVADPNMCDRLEDAARREVQARFVPPGNVLPLYFGGHPAIPGRGPGPRPRP
jgi:hypothetical protein